MIRCRYHGLKGNTSVHGWRKRKEALRSSRVVRLNRRLYVSDQRIYASRLSRCLYQTPLQPHVWQTRWQAQASQGQCRIRPFIYVEPRMLKNDPLGPKERQEGRR